MRGYNEGKGRAVTNINVMVGNTANLKLHAIDKLMNSKNGNY